MVQGYGDRLLRLADNFTDLRTVLPMHPTLTYKSRPLSTIRRIVVHHGGAAVTTPANIARYHVSSKDWPGIGYHFVIDPDGKTYYVGDVTTIRWHASDANTDSVGVCINGNYMEVPPTQAALDALMRLKGILEEYLGIKLGMFGHRDVSAGTVCPGNMLYKELFGPKDARPPKPSEDSVRAWVWDGVSIPYNPDAALAKHARIVDAGAPVTEEIDIGDWIIQGFAKCIIMVRKGAWDVSEVYSW